MKYAYVPYSISFFAFGMILIGAFVLSRHRDLLSLRFFIFSFFAAAWGFSFSFLLEGKLPESQAVVLARFVNGSAAPIPVAWFHFCLAFIGRKEPARYFFTVCYAISLCLVLMSPTPLFVSGIHFEPGFKYYPSPGPFYIVFAFLFMSLVAYAFFYLIRYYLSLKGQAKSQIRYFLFASLLAFSGGTITFLPIYSIPAPMMLVLLMPIYPFLMGIALIRYGLFDPQQMISAMQKEKLMTIGILTASMNHELRNPLYVIQGTIDNCLDRLSRTGDSLSKEESRAFQGSLQTIQEQTLRAAGIVKRFASFAKDRVNQELRFEPIHFAKFLDDLMPLLTPELLTEKISLVRGIPEDLPAFKGDRHLLEEIFFNLIINAAQAIKAGNRAQGEIRIKASCQDSSVLISVEDNGPGMSEEVQANIFKPFYTTKEQGTGLGLYITKQLVEKIGGTIQVCSRARQTTTFNLTLNG